MHQSIEIKAVFLESPKISRHWKMAPDSLRIDHLDILFSNSFLVAILPLQEMWKKCWTRQTFYYETMFVT
jgi:hypothetical protein